MDCFKWRPHSVTVTALANKLVRIIWAVFFTIIRLIPSKAHLPEKFGKRDNKLYFRSASDKHMMANRECRDENNLIWNYSD